MLKFFRLHKVILSLVILLLLLFPVGILLTRGKAVILTDPIWNELYLKQGRRSFLIKKVLCGNLYLPSTKVLPTEIDTETLRNEISMSRDGLFLLSPLLSKPFLAAGLWEDFPDREFIVISFGRGGFPSPEHHSSAENNLIVLSVDGEGLSQKVLELLKELWENRKGFEKILVLHEDSSWVDQDTVRLLREKIEFDLPRPEVRLLDSAGAAREMEATPDAPVLFFPGFGGENSDLLKGLSQRGGTAILVGDMFGLEAWPDSVYATVVPDVEKTLSVVLKEAESNSLRGVYSLFFTVKRGK